MGVDHGGSQVVVAEQFLHRTDVITTFEQVRSKRMPQRVPGCPFGKIGLPNGPLERLLQDGFIHMMPSLITRLVVLPAVVEPSIITAAQEADRRREFRA